MAISFKSLGSRFIWQIQRVISGLGWHGIVATLLFIGCATFGYFVLRPMRQHTLALQAEVARLRQQSRVTLAAEHKTLTSPEQLAAFYRFFPKPDSAFDCMAKLYNAAGQQNLNLEQGEYKLAYDSSGKLQRYEIELPVKGGYVQIRKFIAQAMTDIPSLALNGITFDRKKIEETTVDARIQFTLYLGVG